MILLGIFDFYHFDELTVSTQTDWFAVFITAMFSGGVAWLAAFLQNKYVLWNQYNADVQKKKVKMSMLKGESEEIKKQIKTHIDFLLKSARKMRYDRPYDLTFQSLDLSAFESVLSLNPIDMYELTLFTRNAPDSRLFMEFYSSVKSFKNNYNQQIDIYFKKVEEYNRIITKLHHELLSFSVPIQKVLFSDHIRLLIKKLNESNRQNQRKIIEDNPYLLLVNSVDKIYHRFNTSEEPEYKKTEVFCQELIAEIRSKSDINIFDVEAVQGIVTAIGSVRVLKGFYASMREIYRGYIHSYQKNAEKIDNWTKIDVENSKNPSFLEFVFSKNIDYQ